MFKRFICRVRGHDWDDPWIEWPDTIFKCKRCGYTHKHNPIPN